MIAGDPDEVERLALEALQIGTDCGVADVMVHFGGQLIMANWQRGTMGEMVPLIEGLIADAPDVAGAVTAALALAHAETDRTDDARALLEGFAATGFDLQVDLAWTLGMSAWAEAAIVCRDPKYAGPLFDLLVPWADQLSCTGDTAEGPISHFVAGLAAVLGRYEEAESYFARAAAFNDRARAKFFAARTDLLWGGMLAERGAPGDADRARQLLGRAHATAVTQGYGTVERRAAAALHDLR